MTQLGVGFLGAGIATQAIHLPTVAALAGRLRVCHVMDVDPAVAAGAAATAGARWTTRAADVLSDPEVDIVVVASPPGAHAEQVIAACRSGCRAVLCEKPLATSRDEARLILEASRSSGTPVLVGTMHAYDPACRAAAAAWRSAGSAAVLVRSRINLPPDDVFILAATQPVSVPPPWTPPARPWAEGAAAAFITDIMLGLVIHSIPLVREFIPEPGPVTSAATPAPIGYAVAARCDGCAAEFLGMVAADWESDWSLEAWAPEARLRIEFPPSYVHAGSAVARLETGDRIREWRYPGNGYRAEWDHLADVADGRAEPMIALDTAIADLDFALSLAEGAAGLLEQAAR
jgi:myo-inositol 2-dehydrogenase / D-chiro-inositol 1-dehydrogenase